MSKETEAVKLLQLIAGGRCDQATIQEALKPLRLDLSEANIKTAIATLEKTGSTIALKESFLAMGLSEESAEAAAKDGEAGTLEESFREMGLSEEQAREAAKGRD